ncbi:MAG: potassium transporter TrkA [Candidatus Latescibacteria bacterium 4484_7]|nr:MAG: potassium transporter TrkA [Candidatus Latescibacteria bacterium 4484_7]RKZ08642.1 MAG: TrkA family potassium uptake protein [bacterium]
MAKKYAIIGLGNFGFYVSKTLFEEGHDVVAVDIKEESIEKIRPYCSQAILGDATQKDMIKSLGLEEMDAVIVSMGGNANAATLITLYLKEIGVKKIVVKATNEDHGKILGKVGATDIIYPEKDMAIKVARSLSTPDVLDYIPMSGDYIIAEIAPLEFFVNKSLAELQLRTKYNINVIAIKELVPENFILVPPASFVIKHSDILVVIGRKEDIEKIKKLSEKSK